MKIFDDDTLKLVFAAAVGSFITYYVVKHNVAGVQSFKTESNDNDFKTERRTLQEKFQTEHKKLHEQYKIEKRDIHAGVVQDRIVMYILRHAENRGEAFKIIPNLRIALKPYVIEIRTAISQLLKGEITKEEFKAKLRDIAKNVSHEVQINLKPVIKTNRVVI